MPPLEPGSAPKLYFDLPAHAQGPPAHMLAPVGSLAEALQAEDSSLDLPPATLLQIHVSPLSPLRARPAHALRLSLTLKLGLSLCLPEAKLGPCRAAALLAVPAAPEMASSMHAACAWLRGAGGRLPVQRMRPAHAAGPSSTTQRRRLRLCAQVQQGLASMQHEAGDVLEGLMEDSDPELPEQTGSVLHTDLPLPDPGIPLHLLGPTELLAYMRDGTADELEVRSLCRQAGSRGSAACPRPTPSRAACCVPHAAGRHLQLQSPWCRPLEASALRGPGSDVCAQACCCSMPGRDRQGLTRAPTA